MNAENHRVIDVIKPRKNQYLKNYFLRFDRKARLAVRLVVVNLYDSYRNLINKLFLLTTFILLFKIYGTQNNPNSCYESNRYGKGTREYRALKRYAKLIMTSNENLDFTHYYPRINFKHAWLSS